MATVTDLGWRFDNTYARLPSALFARVRPASVRAPRLVVLNAPLAEAMGLSLDGASPQELAAVFSGQQLPEGADPIAQAYAGHQFGGFTILGDGRAILLGEQWTPDGRLLDVQLKGAGPTPFSRRGDGLAALGPMLREYVVSEAMHHLGIPTTRGLAVVATGEPVYRERPLPGAVLTRIAASHLRVGTFEWCAARGDVDLLRVLVRYAIQRHAPDLAEAPDPALDLLRATCAAQASLVARWLGVGFVHGVMNTDNMSLAGETIDYGPCAFLDRYDPGAVFSSIDHHGRYAYAQQPGIAQWNLARFAEALLPLIHAEPAAAAEQATAVLEGFAERFQREWLDVLRAKLGLALRMDHDAALAERLLDVMRTERADFTTTFRTLAEAPDALGAAFAPWVASWRERLAAEGAPEAAALARARAANPAVIARNHRVEEALAAAEQDDLAPLTALVDALRRPFAPTAADARFRAPPADPDAPYRTFCGT